MLLHIHLLASSIWRKKWRVLQKGFYYLKLNWYKFSNTSDGVLKVFCYRKMDKTTGTSWGLRLLGGGGYSKDSWGWQAVILIWCCEADSKKRKEKKITSQNWTGILQDTYFEPWLSWKSFLRKSQKRNLQTIAHENKNTYRLETKCNRNLYL